MEACLGVRHTIQCNSSRSRKCRNHQSRETAQIVCNALTSAHACAEVKKDCYTMKDIERVSSVRVRYDSLTGKSVIDSSIRQFGPYMK